MNAADMHRVRMLLPFMEREGWEVTVLAVSPVQVISPKDPWLVDGLPDHMAVHRVEALGTKWGKVPGLGNLGLRALRSLASTGDQLLSNGGFDLVYFSTTVFEVHILGPRWKRRFGVPFVMDYQDPWVNDYYRQHPHVTPPGGRFKYALSSGLHRWMEPRVLKACSGITSTSPDYPRQLAGRYPWLKSLPYLIEPFCGSPRDFLRLRDSNPIPHHFDPHDGHVHWVYVGVVVPMMEFPLRAFFSALRSSAPAELLDKLRMHFLGTSYAPAGTAQPRVVPIASDYGLQGNVHEVCDRIPYSEALQCLLDAQALLAFGSDDPGYTPSKIYPYLLARKPLLAVFREHSPVTGLLDEVGGAVNVPFDPGEGLDQLGGRIADHWLLNKGHEQVHALDEAAFLPRTDSESAHRVCEFLKACLDA